LLLNIKLLPKKPARILKHTLENIKSVSDKMAMMSKSTPKGRSDTTEAMDIDFQSKRREVGLVCFFRKLNYLKHITLYIAAN